MRWGEGGREGGREGQRDRGRERASEFDVFTSKMTTLSMLGRHWTECLLHSLVRSFFGLELY